MKGKPTQEIIRPAAYDSEAASHSGIMQRLSGGDICTYRQLQP